MTNWVRNTNDERAVDDGCYFDIAAADKVRTFFAKFLRHSKGAFAGKPFTLLDWQWIEIVAPLFGWKRRDGSRRFRRCGVWIPKKNGKSTLASGLSLYMLVGDGEHGAEIINAANDRKQASIVFDEAHNMVVSSPSLSKHVVCIPSKKRLEFPRTASSYDAISAEAGTKEGINAHFVLHDEIHASKTRTLYDTLKFAGIARRQPIEMTISTAGDDKRRIGYELYQYAKGVASGRIDDWTFLPFIAEAPDDADWTDPATHELANPSYGVTIQPDEMVDSCKEAQATPVRENTFRRYRLNQWTEQETRWISTAAWDACDETFTDADVAGLDCYGGLDLASKTDLTSFALVWKLGNGVCIRPYYWIPRERCDERDRKANNTQFNAWVRAGLLRVTDGNVTDYDAIRRDINAITSKYKVKEIAFDPWNATQMALDLQMDRHKVVEFRQTFFAMHEPSTEFESLVISRRLRHNAHPILRWNLQNVAVAEDVAGNIRPAKNLSTEKIDGVVASIMGLGRLIRTQKYESVYQHRGIRTIS